MVGTFDNRLPAHLVFSCGGNASPYLGRGWAVEETHAWAVGPRSELILPVPNDGAAYVLEAKACPRLIPPALWSQRLLAVWGRFELASYELTEPATVRIPLPAPPMGVSGGVTITFLLPDASRPSVVTDGEEGRALGFAFRDATIIRSVRRDTKMRISEDRPTVSQRYIGFWGLERWERS